MWKVGDVLNGGREVVRVDTAKKEYTIRFICGANNMHTYPFDCDNPLGWNTHVKLKRTGACYEW